MRYFLTLPFAAMALAATPAMAQDSSTPPEPTTSDAPSAEPTAPVPATPPIDSTPVPADGAVPPPADPLPTPAETATPSAQATPAPPAATASLTAEQQAAYDGWPVATKAYFDGLNPTRQELFLRISDADKAKLVALPADQQEAVWTSVEQQAAQQDAAAN